MAGPRRRAPRAGGALFAAAILLGVAAGAIAGESSIGFIAGLAIGLIFVLLIWLLDRRRT